MIDKRSTAARIRRARNTLRAWLLLVALSTLGATIYVVERAGEATLDRHSAITIGVIWRLTSHGENRTRAVDLMRAEANRNPTLQTYWALGHCLEEAGRTGDALTAYETGLHSRPTIFGDRNYAVAMVHIGIGRCLLRCGRDSDARSELDLAIVLAGNAESQSERTGSRSDAIELLSQIKGKK